MDPTDSPEAMFFIEAAAHGAVARAALVALFKVHPQPEALRQALRETQQMPGSLDGQMPAPIQARVDEMLGELMQKLQR